MTETNHLREPRVYLAGPNQHSLCSWLDGHHVLESFANNLGGDGKKCKLTAKCVGRVHPIKGDREQCDVCGKSREVTGPENGSTGNIARYRATFSSMALDSGAYSNMTAQKRGEEDKVTLGGYVEFAKKHGEFYDWCAVMDDITGGADGNRRNWEECKAHHIPRLMPVFHQGEPWSLLEEYASASAYVGLGFQRPIQNEAAWLDGCFQRIPERVWVHGFAMTGYMRWPFRSTDSTTWLHEVKDMAKASGQGRSALAYLTQRELVELVVKKYQRQWKTDLWHGTFGVAAGRGEQLDLESVMRHLDEVERGNS